MRLTRRRWARALAIAVVVISTVAGAGLVCFALREPPQTPVPEVAVKAAFVAQFPQFVEWPATTAWPDASLQLCLSPAHPFGSQIEELTRQRTVRGRPVAVRVLKKHDAPKGCHLMYVAPEDRDLLPRVGTEPVLTVGSDPDFMARGGIVNLKVVAGHVRFELSLPHARRASLRLDPQLLRLAVTVHGGQP